PAPYGTAAASLTFDSMGTPRMPQDTTAAPPARHASRHRPAVRDVFAFRGARLAAGGVGYDPVVPGPDDADLDAAIDRLYSLPLADFTAERNTLVKRLRGEGRKDAASAVQALVKPSVSAWAVNRLARTE